MVIEGSGKVGWRLEIGSKVVRDGEVGGMVGSEWGGGRDGGEGVGGGR